VFDALKILADHDVGALMVMDQGKLVGMLSERDYTRKIALAGKCFQGHLGAGHHDVQGASPWRPTPASRTAWP